MGIDPGLSGAITVIHKPGTLTITEMPSNEADILGLLFSHKKNSLGGGGIKAVLERIKLSIFGASKSSNMKLYGSYMGLRMALTAANIPYEIIWSQNMWRELGVAPRKKGEKVNKWKGRLAMRAKVLYPGINIPKQVADSVLIAHYCQIKSTLGVSDAN
jgi:hypothetical protein